MKGNDLADLMQYDDLCARVYADPRADTQARTLLLGLAWILLRDPARRFDTGATLWHRWIRLMGRSSSGEPLLRELVGRDAPRYEPEYRWAGRCEGPRMRPYRPRGYAGATMRDPRAADDRVCGDRATHYCVERDPVTGWHTRHWFCSRHQQRLREVKEQFDAVEAPPPIPNRGGLLPAYFTCSNWDEVYRWASSVWRPPYYGVNADDWPDPTDAPKAQPRRPRLSLIIGGAQPEPE